MRKNAVRILVVMAMIFMLSAGTAAEAAPVTGRICLYGASMCKSERVYISKTSITLKVGRFYRLKAWTSSSKNVKGRWVSKRPNIASVDKATGWVKAKKVGITYITVTIDGEFQRCRVIVIR